MRYDDPAMQSISAPIPVPGTQQEPTVPSTLVSLTSPTIAASHVVDLDFNNDAGSNGNKSLTALAGGVVSVHSSSYLANTLNVNPSSPAQPTTVLQHHNYHSINNLNNTPHNTTTHGTSGMSYINLNNPNNINSGLRRFPSLIGPGTSKKLTAENSTLRAKVTELERYLTGLKEELILAYRQIHTKDVEAKVSQERKSVEIHELGQHIQRCEVDLLKKTAECEALQNKLQYQAREQMVKLKHITLLESEIMDFKRLSTSSGTGTGSGANSGASMGSAFSRNSRDSSDLTAFATAAATGAQNSSNEEALGLALSQIQQLKNENAHKDDQFQELFATIKRMNTNVSCLEQQQQQQPTSIPAVDSVSETSVSASSSDASFSTAIIASPGSHSSSSSSAGRSRKSSINSVGYDVSFEHPKLLARYQALRMQHAQASEYVEELESENRDLKVQLLDITVAPSTGAAAAAPMVVVVPSIATNSLHHPAASVLAPLNMNALGGSTVERASSSCTTATPSPTSATTATGSPLTQVAPALPSKSSLRYSRDGHHQALLGPAAS